MHAKIHLLENEHFNPRSREGSDLRSVDSFSSKFDFNPRSREGSDAKLASQGDIIPISIHAPVKGATGLRHFLIHHVKISIHAPVKGATAQSLREGVRLAISIHAPVKGATHGG